MQIPVFYRGIIIFLVGLIPMLIIFLNAKIDGLDTYDRILISMIIAMIPLIVLVSKSERIFPTPPRGTMPKGWNKQQKNGEVNH